MGRVAFTEQAPPFRARWRLRLPPMPWAPVIAVLVLVVALAPTDWVRAIAAAVVCPGACDLSPPIRKRAELFERQMIQPQRLGLADALTIPDRVQQFVQ